MTTEQVPKADVLFAQAVQTGPRGSHVDATQVDWETPTGEFRYFDVEHSI